VPLANRRARSGLFVQVTRTDRPMTDEDRRHVAAVVSSGLVMNSRPSTSHHISGEDEGPIDLQGIIMHRGGTPASSVRVMTSNEVGQRRVHRALANVGRDYAVETGTVARTRRFVIGLTGYMAAMPPQDIIRVLEMQNPDLPRGGITAISLFPGRGEQPRPVLFADVSEEAITFLTSVGMSLRTFSSSVGVRPLTDRDE
jgi:hypothetical protein